MPSPEDRTLSPATDIFNSAEAVSFSDFHAHATVAIRRDCHGAVAVSWHESDAVASEVTDRAVQAAHLKDH